MSKLFLLTPKLYKSNWDVKNDIPPHQFKKLSYSGNSKHRVALIMNGFPFSKLHQFSGSNLAEIP